MIFAICVVAILQLSDIMAQTSENPVEVFKQTVRNEVATMWQGADSNGDGRFEEDDMETIFNEYDDDHNGQISQKEFETDFTANVSGLAVVADGLFLELDMDRDNSITRSDVKLYYQRIDTNNDNTVEKQEFVDYFSKIMTLLFVLQYESSSSASSMAPAHIGVGR